MRSDHRVVYKVVGLFAMGVAALGDMASVLAAPPDARPTVTMIGSRRVLGRPPEQQDQPAIPEAALGRRQETPGGVFQVGPFVSVQVNVNGAGMNIVGDAANEPSIAVNPIDRTKMAIGWRQFDSIASNFREAGRAFTQNGGASWTFPGVLDNGLFRSDPVLDSDAAGNFYYSSLRNTNPFSAQIFKSVDGGVTWGVAVPASGGDKQWLAVDDRPAGMGAGHVYHNWNVQFSCCGTADFTRSINGGVSYQVAIAIPQPSMKWGANDVGPDGTLYIAGSTLNQDGHLIARSSTAMNPGLNPTFDFVNSVNMGGFTGGFGGGSDPNPGGLLGQVWVAADPSNANRVYMFASVLPTVGVNPIDVMFSRSVNRGQTWSPPTRVNTDPASGAFHWMGTLAVAPNGRVDAIWNDTRNTGVGNMSQLYYASSVDGGQTWLEVGPLTPIWNSHVGWPQQNKIGDYYHMNADLGGSSLAYAATFNGEQDVYFLRIPADCNQNATPDDQDVTIGGAPDCNGNLIPDACEPNADCNLNTIQDICDIESGFSTDCNLNYIPDSCEAPTDCNNNTIPDICDIAAGAPDCNANNIPDTCDIDDQTSQDANGNNIPDECEGACCQCNGACTLINSAGCAAIFGTFQGIGVSCGDVVCGAPNDLCTQAIVLPRDPVQSIAFDNTCATDDAPTAIDCATVGTDLWYQYKPPCTGTVRASLCGTANFDTVLSVYGGTVACSCPVSPTSLACGDDDCGIGGGPSEITFSAIKDRCYLIRVAGWQGSIGRGVLNVSYDTACDPLPPAVVWDPNDAANRALIFQTVPPSAAVTADSNPGHAALKVTMVDLQHLTGLAPPGERNQPQFPPPNFTAFDTAADSACVGGQYADHHCHTGADCVGTTNGTCTPSAPACGEAVNGAQGGCARWVGPPQVYMHAPGVPARGTWIGARLQCTPYYTDWAALPQKIAVFGADVVPSSEYLVAAYASSCKGIEGTCGNVSASVPMSTRRWGDVAPSFNPPSTTSQPDGNDVATLVNLYFRPGAGMYKPFGMLQPNVPPMGVSVSGLEVGQLVSAFQFRAYPFTGPCVCPAGFACASCSAGSACPAGQSCQKRCVGGPHDLRPCDATLDCGLCTAGPNLGFPCAVAGDCGTGGVCDAHACTGGTNGLCVDACGRCGL